MKLPLPPQQHKQNNLNVHSNILHLLNLPSTPSSLRAAPHQDPTQHTVPVHTVASSFSSLIAKRKQADSEDSRSEYEYSDDEVASPYSSSSKQPT